MEGAFNRYLSVEVVSDPFDAEYRVKYIERVEERGAVRFEKREGRIPRGEAEGLVEELMRMVRINAK